MLLSLDQSSSATGWALGEIGTRTPAHGTLKMPKTGNDLGRMLALFGDGWLRKKIRDNSVTLVAFERPIMPVAKVKWIVKQGRNVPVAYVETQFPTLRKLYALAGEIERVCHDMQIECVEEHVQTWRANFVQRDSDGKKDSSKDAIIPQCRAIGWDPANHNEADALGLWAHISARRSKTPIVTSLPMLQGAA